MFCTRHVSSGCSDCRYHIVIISLLGWCKLVLSKKKNMYVSLIGLYVEAYILITHEDNSHLHLLGDNLLTLYTRQRTTSIPHPLTSLSHPKFRQCRCPARVKTFQALLSKDGVMVGTSLGSWRSVVKSHYEYNIAVTAVNEAYWD